MMKTWIPIAFIFLTACDVSDLQNVPLPGSNGTNGSGGSTTGSPATPTPTPTYSPPPTGSSGSVPSLSASLGIQENVDLRTYDGPIMNQFGGTCSAFATAAAMNNLLKQRGINKLVSERHLWDLYGVYDMDAAITTASSHYITESKYWPSSSSYPLNSTYTDYASLKITQYKTHGYGNINAALRALHQGHPVVMAIRVPRDLSNCEETISATSSSTSGEHVMAVVGYHLDDSVSGGGYFILKNSWGTTCGDHGYHYYPFQLCKRSDLYCYFSEVISVEDRL